MQHDVPISKTPKINKKAKATKTTFSGLTVFMLVVLIIYAVSLIALFIYGFTTSFKFGQVGKYEYRQEYMPGNPYKLPINWHWDNYVFVFKNFAVYATDNLGVGGTPRMVGFGEMFLNAILYSVGCAFFHTAVTCLTAYGCARFPYRYSKIVHTAVIVVMIIPIVGSAPSELAMALRLGLYNKIWGMWIMRANFLGVYFLVFYEIFRALPASYTEAAKIDGAGNWAILFRIILPLAINTFLTVLLIDFIHMWNDYQIPLLYLPSYPTIAFGLFSATNSTMSGLETTPRRLCAAIIMLVPILIVFLLTQKRLLGNLTIGGVKG